MQKTQNTAAIIAGHDGVSSIEPTGFRHRPVPAQSARFLKALCFSACMSGLGLLPRLAHASPNFPSVVRDHLEMACTPKCTICHESNPGVSGTANQLFAETIKATRDPAERSGWNADEIVQALDKVKQAATDSDGDGVADILELQAGSGAPGATGDAPRDPSVSGEGEPCADVVLYGCGAARVAPRDPGSALWSALAVAALLAWSAGRLARRKPGRRPL